VKKTNRFKILSHKIAVLYLSDFAETDHISIWNVMIGVFQADSQKNCENQSDKVTNATKLVADLFIHVLWES